MGFFDNFDTRVDGDFTDGEISTSFKYTSTNGYQGGKNNYNADCSIPDYFELSHTMATDDWIEVGFYFYVPSISDTACYGISGLAYGTTTSTGRGVIHAGPFGQGSDNFEKSDIMIYKKANIESQTNTNSEGIDYTHSTWYYKKIKLTKNASSCTIDVTITRASDDVEIHTDSMTSTDTDLNAATWFSFGAQDGHGSGSPGYSIDEMTINYSWDVQLAKINGISLGEADPFDGHASLAVDLEAYYNFDDDVSDSTGIYDLTNNDTTSTTGKINDARAFAESSTQYLERDSTSDLNVGTGSYSYNCWIYVASSTDFSAYHTVFCKGGTDSGNGGAEMIVAESAGKGQFAYLRTGAWARLPNTYDWTVAEWQMLTFTWDGTTSRIYRNGTEITGGTSTSGSWSNTVNKFEVGKNYQGTANARKYWNGKIDELGIWSKALTTTEITDLYNSGDGLTY